ncbi:NUDIX domain-containing protein [Streptomyces sp. NPDC012623]|uniref:NUDIX domain-containing protein n=1 Tax=unclassified Streptomyces TaxID=2593676 RepID=UPI0036BB514A
MPDTPNLPPAGYYASLATHYAAAEALVEDPRGRVLLVKPTYRPDWSLPGGMVEDGEEPHAACAREAEEELGLVLAVGRMLAVDWAPAEGIRPRPMALYVFDCGTLGEDPAVVLPPEEIEDWCFVEPDRAGSLLTAGNNARMHAARHARARGVAHYVPRMA